MKKINYISSIILLILICLNQTALSQSNKTTEKASKELKTINTDQRSLYNIEESQIDEPFPLGKIYYDKGAVLDFPDSATKLKLNFLLQPRLSFTGKDQGENSNSFNLERARIDINGSVLAEEFSYKLQTNLSSQNNNRPNNENEANSPELLDAYLKWQPCDCWGHFKVGQFRALISRQESTTKEFLQFPDRTYLSDSVRIGRSQGAEIHYEPEASSYLLNFAVFNGESINEGSNRAGKDTNLTAVASARANLLGEMNPLIEGDLDKTKNTALNIGASYSYGSGSDTLLNNLLSDFNSERMSTDLNIKSNGFSFHSEYLSRNLEDKFSNTKSTLKGFYVQSAYFLKSDLEIAARYSKGNCNKDNFQASCINLDKFEEIGASLNYFILGNQLKTQLAWKHLKKEEVLSADKNNNSDQVMFEITAIL